MNDKLHTLIEDKCLIIDTDITLSIGEKSSFYFDCKKVTLDGEGLDLIASAFLDQIDRLPTQPQAIGGLTMGADFIVAAVAMKAFQLGRSPAIGSIVRKEPKKHGTRNYIENQIHAETTIVVVDDVITSGQSTAQACDKFIEAGYKIVGIVALVDREQGGTDTLHDRFQVPVLSVFKRRNFPKLEQATHDQTPVNAVQCVQVETAFGVGGDLNACDYG